MDNFIYHNPGLSAPASRAFAINPNDDHDLEVSTRGLYIGSAGNVAVVLVHDTEPVIVAAVPAGSILPLRIKRVRETGTTAAGLVGLC